VDLSSGEPFKSAGFIYNEKSQYRVFSWYGYPLLAMCHYVFGLILLVLLNPIHLNAHLPTFISRLQELPAPIDLLMESDRSQLGQIDSRRARFPCCIVWTPIPFITWLVPFIGHIGICREDGVILDFAGPNFISVDNFAFGAVARYIQVNSDQVCTTVYTCHSFTSVLDWIVSASANEMKALRMKGRMVRFTTRVVTLKCEMLE
jgi:hypothetical protein